MRISRVFTDQPLTPGAEAVLDERASAHLVRVLRLGAGAALRVFDGHGDEAEATLATADARAARVRLGAVTRQAPPARPIHLVQGISRGERMDYTLQKAVELGVSRISPAECLRSVTRLKAGRAGKRLAHWRGVVVAACEQSGRAWVPAVEEPRPLERALADAAPGLRLILEVEGACRLGELAGPAGGAAITLVAGPEGGFDPRERELARAAGFTALRLGPRVLRTETAALAALAALQTLWGDFG